MNKFFNDLVDNNGEKICRDNYFKDAEGLNYFYEEALCNYDEGEKGEVFDNFLD